MLDAEAIAEEHGAQGVCALAERVGIEIDEQHNMTALAITARLALDLGVPEDMARNNMQRMHASLTILWTYSFLAGALWMKEQQEEDE